MGRKKRGTSLSKRYNVAIMGVTGAVGEEMLQILEQRAFPVDRLVLLASKKSVGKSYRFRPPLTQSGRNLHRALRSPGHSPQ